MNSIIPNHIAIIPDGNRRWAQERKLPSFEGHRRGFQAGITIAKKIRSLGVSTLTVWGLSTENVSRSKEEVGGLMKLYEFFIDQQTKDLIKEKTRFTHLGRKDRMPQRLVDKLNNIELKTKHFINYYLNVALDYGGRDEVLRTIKRLFENHVDISNLEEEVFNAYLDTKGQPYPFPDLIIRTGGEIRTSGFMIWQAAYAEWIFLDKYFPDINGKDIENAVFEYSRRQRRFGK